MQKPCENCFLFFCSLVGLMEMNPLDFKASFGACLSVADIRIWNVQCGVRTLQSSGSSLEF